MDRIYCFWGKLCHALQHSKIQISLILLIGLIHGSIFVFIMPPWQHYDEPGHFEYAKLIALRSSIPLAGDYDSLLAKEIYTSLVKWKFFPPEQAVTLPDQKTSGAVYRIWINQIGDPPFYYTTAALLLRFFASQSIEFQLYSGRFLSLLFFLITIWASYRFTAEVTAPNSFLRWMVPATIALLPGTVDLMTAFSNDPPAVMFSSLLLLVCTMMIRRGIKPALLIYALLLALACVLTKRTIWIILLALPIALIFSIFRGKFKIIGWGIVLFGVLVGVLALFDWNDAALWYRDTLQTTPTRVLAPDAARNAYAFQLRLNPQQDSPALYQIIPLDESNRLPGKVVTLGSWMWASAETTAQAAGIRLVNKSRNVEVLSGPTVTLSTTPVFYAATFLIPEDASRVFIALNPNTVSSQDTTVYYMNPVLAEGQHPSDSIPVFTDQQKTVGTWGGLFKNLVRNANASQFWPRIKPSVLPIINRASPDMIRPLNWAMDFLDWRGNRWYLIYSLRSIFRTFWGKFGWGSVPLIGKFTYRILEFYTVLIIAGLGIGFVTHRKLLPWSIIIFFGFIILFTFGIALFTCIAVGSLISRDYIPVARTLLPMILPIAFCISAGWLSLFEVIKHKTWMKFIWLNPIIFFSSLLWLDIISYVSITHFYNLWLVR